MLYEPEFAGEQISDYTYLETIGDEASASQKVLVVPGFFNEEVGGITERVRTAVTDQWPNTVAMIVHCNDPLMVRRPHGIRSSWEDLTMAEEHFQALAPGVSSRELDISLGAGKRLMNPTVAVRPKVAFSMVADPVSYWEASKERLRSKNFIAPGDGHPTNVEALEAIGNAYEDLSEKVFDLVLMEDRPFYPDLDLMKDAERLFERGAIGVLETISDWHGYLRNRTAQRLRKFWEDCEDKLVA